LAQILLFVGTILVAFQFVGDIGYVATLLAMPFALPFSPLMRKLGVGYKRVSLTQLSFQMDEQMGGATQNKFARVIYFILLVIAMIVFSVVTIASQPIMLVYLFVCRPLVGINKLLNVVYQESTSSWNIMYLVLMQRRIKNLQDVGIKTTKKHYSDRDLLKIRKQKGELPFVAFFGLICIVAGFVIELTG